MPGLLLLPPLLLLLLLLRGGSPVGAGLPPGPEEVGGPSLEPRRPYAVLQAQHLGLTGSVLSVLLAALVWMAVCVYKPLRRR